MRRSMGQALAPLAGDLLEDADTAGRLDFIIQKALFAVRYGGVRPEITETELELTDMINPELCDLLEQKGRSFVPVSDPAGAGATVITGANMGGKSVVMKPWPERAAFAGGLSGLRQGGPDAAVLQREDAL